MSLSSIVSKENAKKLLILTPGDIEIITKLTSLSIKPVDVPQILQDIADGKSRNDLPMIGIPKPVVIQAYSFLRDKQQFGHYNISSVTATELLDLLERDPDAASKGIHDIVQAKLKVDKSPKAVHVTLAGMPGKPGGASNSGPTGDGGASVLADEIASNSSIYGCYKKFDPELTGRSGAQAYAVHLGNDLFVLGQSKKVCIAAARIVRVKGRHDPLIRPYTYYWRLESSPRGCDDIPSSVFDGKLHFVADTPPRGSPASSKTVAHGRSG
uniref:PAS-rich protein n=1 Tax=Plasmopara viticola lesion associated polymycovirus 2 TaxID=2695349 RepID=A0A6B9QQK6_9VIRU|nr:PAS-rich protein [Plasmopara viticola lesion associated polymycovirus 2]